MKNKSAKEHEETFTSPPFTVGALLCIWCLTRNKKKNLSLQQNFSDADQELISRGGGTS